MTGDADRAKVEALFEAALELPEPERERWLSELSDPDLAARIRALLEAHARSAGILESPPRAQNGATRPEIDRLGPYRLLRELGRGGMGKVYLARREDAFMRRVAVKIVRADLASEEVARRLADERQIMASLNHPNIAQLLDGGVTDEGRPYLVMEYVEGMPITDYCSRERLDLDERLELFRKVCDAVHHAHRNLVIHRDLKPSNILVTMDGQPKLLDFGIAKVVRPVRSSLADPSTGLEAQALTPDYASPEQLRGEPLTTASDVYALGALLYEMLSGRRPFERTSGSAVEAGNEADREHPRPPSEHAPPELARKVRGDLDSIVLKALRIEPGRRYPSVAQLSDDVAAYLAGEAVSARGESRSYRAVKFLGRHRVETAAGAVMLVSLLAALAVAIWQTGLAREERDRATAALDRAQATADFMVGLYEADALAGAGGDTLSARAMLARGMARARELDDFPSLQARLIRVLGNAYMSLGALEEAADALDRVKGIYAEMPTESMSADQQADVADVHADLATALSRLGRYEEARRLALEAYDLRVANLGEAHPDVATSLMQRGSIAVYFGDLAAADSLTRLALSIRAEALGSEDPLVTNAIEGLSAIAKRRGRVDEAEALLRDAMARRRAIQGADDSQYATAMVRLANLLTEDRDQHAEAEALYRRALEIYPPDHPDAPSAMADLGEVLAIQGRYDEAIEALDTTLEQRRALHGSRHSSVANALYAKGTILFKAGKLEESEAAHREALAVWTAVLGPEHSATAYALCGLADVLAARGQVEDAEVLARQALSIRRDALAPENLLIPLTEAVLANVLSVEGRYEEAEQLLVGALDRMGSRLPPTHRDVRGLHRQLADLYERWGKPVEAARHRVAAEGPPPD